MRTSRRLALGLLSILLCLPAFAAGDCPAIQSVSADDVQTGQPLTITWSYTGGAPASQTLTGHDFAEPIAIPAGQTTYTYTPTMPGEKHAQLVAVTACGTVTAQVKYHVKQCNVVAPVLTLDQTSVKPGDVIQASIDLLPGHTARWEVRNGTASATTGSSIQVTAGTPGTVAIDVFVTRGNSCSVLTSGSVEVVAPCSIVEPMIITPERAAANEIWGLIVPAVPAGHTITFEVRGAQQIGSGPNYLLVMAPPSGSFEADVIVSNGTCTRRFTRTGTVTPCAPTATVSVGAGNTCDNLTIVAEFTGTAPYQGYWSDGVSIFSWEPRLERQVTASGTYSITYFRDRFCVGTATGSAQVGASLPVPEFTIDPVAFGLYMGSETCPGMPRVATLTAPVPAGVEVAWSITNGTILSGQNTATVRFAGIAPGATTLTAVLRNADGCTSQPFTAPALITVGAPAASISVAPATIKPGETAIVTLTTNNYVRGTNITSSLGDAIVYLGTNPDSSSRWEYRASHGAGIATIHAFVQNACGMSAFASTTLTIEGAPAGPSATVRALGTTCTDYMAYAELTGTAPFSGTWSDGTTFTSDYPWAFLRPKAGGTYTLVAYSDANGPGTISGSATFNFVKVPVPEFSFNVATACPGSIVTATLANPLPAGAITEWLVSGGELLSGQGTDTIQIRAGDSYVNAQVQITGSACSIESAYRYIPVVAQAPQAPLIDLYGVEVGGSAIINVYLDPNTATWAFENSLGDPMEVVGNPQPNVYAIRYTSTHGTGTSTVRIYGTNHCGLTFEGTRDMVIMAAQPTATITSTLGENCGAVLTVTFTGTAPFTATWGDTGQTFTTNSTTYTRFVGNAGFYYLSNVSDANRTDGFGSGVYADVKYLPYAQWQMSADNSCAGGTINATAIDVPAGYTVEWTIEGANASIVSGQGTSEIVISTPEAGQFLIMARYRTPEGCESPGWGYYVAVTTCGQE